ncbi:MAG: EscN/YscN/HrcN family type III secretion system ATPase, partial [Syntrophomonadaceae bacterium]|nr:EscN/YscN/HrcN family type III secretion system ATPase [Syntrophomonadaceae bacterium]
MNKFLPSVNLEPYFNVLEKSPTCQLKGRISQAVGLTIEATGPRVSLGELCYIRTNYADRKVIPAEVVGFRDDKI